jgi:hypothetical protein
MYLVLLMTLTYRSYTLLLCLFSVLSLKMVVLVQG